MRSGRLAAHGQLGRKGERERGKERGKEEGRQGGREGWMEGGRKRVEGSGR